MNVTILGKTIGTASTFSNNEDADVVMMMIEDFTPVIEFRQELIKHMPTYNSSSCGSIVINLEDGAITVFESDGSGEDTTEIENFDWVTFLLG